VDTVVGGAVEKALQQALGSMENVADSGGTPPDAATKKQMLQEALGKAKEEMFTDAALNGGLDEKQLEMLGKVFDRAGEREMAKLEKTGTVEPKEPLGRGKDKLDPEQTDDTRSRQIMFENLKFKMNMLSEMMQSMSNILNTMHQNAENTIRAIR
jgi:hypothetical protein